MGPSIIEGPHYRIPITFLRVKAETAVGVEGPFGKAGRQVCMYEDACVCDMGGLSSMLLYVCISM